MLFHFYRTPALSPARKKRLLNLLRESVFPQIKGLETEFCYNVQTQEALSEREIELLTWLLGETFEVNQFGLDSFFPERGISLEVGPRLSFKSAWCTNALAICHTCGLAKISRIERSRRYLVVGSLSLTPARQEGIFYGEEHGR